MQPDYTLLGPDLTGFSLQPGFVEGIITDRRRFSTLVQAYRHIFRRNLEYAVLLWNGLPVRLSYPEDLPNMVPMLIEMLEAVQKNESTRQTCPFHTPNLQGEWQIDCEADMLSLEGSWEQVPGHYEAALNRLGMVRISRLDFLCEWKLLLQQLNQAIMDAGATITSPEGRDQLQILQRLEKEIPFRGRFYRYSK